MKKCLILLLVSFLGFLVLNAGAEDTPTQWHENLSRNNVVPAEDLPNHLGDDNRLWHLELQGRPFFSIITIEGNRVYCAMSAKNLPEPEKEGGGILCLDLESGKILWQTAFGSGGGAYGLSIVPMTRDEGIYAQL